MRWKCKHGAATAALLSLIACTQLPAGHADKSTQRDIAAARLQARHAAVLSHKQHIIELSQRATAGEDVRTAYNQAREQAPNYTDVRADALMLAEADLADEAGFIASVVLLSEAQARREAATGTFMFTAQEQALHLRLAQGLIAHHLSRANIMEAGRPFSAIASPAQAIPFLETVQKESPHQAVHLWTIYALCKSYGEQLNAPDTSPEQRESLRLKFQNLFALAHRTYPTEKSLAAVIALTEKTLTHSAGRRLPDVQAHTLDGRADSLSRYRGKIVLLDFWATWCGPCVRAQPELVRFKNALQGRPFEIIALSVDRNAQKVLDHMQQQPMPWVNWHIGHDSPIVTDWNILGYPSYLILDAEGVVQSRGHHFGTREQARVLEMVAAIESPPATH